MSVATVDENTLVEAIRPTLDAFVLKAEPVCRKAAETVYETLLYSVQDYLRDNAEWNIGAELARCRRIELDNLHLREANKEMLEALVSLERWFNTDQEILDAMSPDERADHDRQIGKMRALIARAKGGA